MKTPTLTLLPGEEILATMDALRRKGLAGNLYGQLHVTTQRVVFMKAWMKMGLITPLLLKLFRPKPLFTFARSNLRLDVQANNNRQDVQLSDGTTTEKLQQMTPEDISRLVALLG